jgi:hypothetical protein
MATLSIRRLWVMYQDIMSRDNTIATSKGGRIFSRTLAHGAFYAGARSTLKVLAYYESDHLGVISCPGDHRATTGMCHKKNRPPL